MSFVPDPEQRLWRTVTRRKYQLTCDKLRLQNQLEALLEEVHIKLSSLVSDLLGVSARRMLKAMAEGETNPAALAAMGDERLRATPAQLCDALSACAELQPTYRRLLKMFLKELQLIEQQIRQLDQELARLLNRHQDAVVRLAQVLGLGVDSAQQIMSEVGARPRLEIMLFLHSYGVSTSRAVRIFKTYGEQAIEKVRSNPYTLAKDIYGIGFATADQIAQKVGIPRDSLNRARAGIDHVLLEATSDGQCALTGEAQARGGEAAGGAGRDNRAGVVADAHEWFVAAGGDRRGAAHLPAAPQEGGRGIAARIKSLAEAEPIYPPIDFDKAVAWCEGRTGKTLAPSQREALKTVLSNLWVVITGGPGLGKTTLVNSILMILRAKGVKCLLCAPTGRAAKRLTETTGMEAKTIHRLLEIDPATGRFSRNEWS
jgi:ribosomal protein S13